MARTAGRWPRADAGSGARDARASSRRGGQTTSRPRSGMSLGGRRRALVIRIGRARQRSLAGRIPAVGSQRSAHSSPEAMHGGEPSAAARRQAVGLQRDERGADTAQAPSRTGRDRRPDRRSSALLGRRATSKPSDGLRDQDVAAEPEARDERAARRHVIDLERNAVLPARLPEMLDGRAFGQQPPVGGRPIQPSSTGAAALAALEIVEPAAIAPDAASGLRNARRCRKTARPASVRRKLGAPAVPSSPTASRPIRFSRPILGIGIAGDLFPARRRAHRRSSRRRRRPAGRRRERRRAAPGRERRGAGAG